MILRYIWLVMLISGISLLILTIILSLVWRVFNIIGELNGKNAKKQIERLKNIKINNTTGNLIVDTEDGDIEELPIKDFSLGVKSQIDEVNIIEDEVSTGQLNIKEDYNVTTYIEDDKTSFIDDLNEYDATSYIEEEVNKDKHIVKVLEEILSFSR